MNRFPNLAAVFSVVLLSSTVEAQAPMGKFGPFAGQRRFLSKDTVGGTSFFRENPHHFRMSFFNRRLDGSLPFLSPLPRRHDWHPHFDFDDLLRSRLHRRFDAPIQNTIVTTQPQSYRSPYEGLTNPLPVAIPKPVEKPLERDIAAAAGLVGADGEMLWPLGLKILPGEEAKELRAQIEAIVRVLSIQASQGRVNAQLCDELRRKIERLERLLVRDQAERLTLTAYMYGQSQRFTSKVRDACQVFLALNFAPGSNVYSPNSTLDNPVMPAPAKPY